MIEWVQSWLSLQCHMIAGVSKGLVLLGPPDSQQYTLTACWPDNHCQSQAPLLQATADTGFKQKEVIIHQPQQSSQDSTSTLLYMAVPIHVNGQNIGVIALELNNRNEAQRQAVLELLRWGSLWAQLLIKEQTQNLNDRLLLALSFVSTCLSHKHFQASATALVTELSVRLSCQRVSLGFIKRNRIEIKAMSHSADFDNRANMIRDISAAMEEAIDQKTVITYNNAAIEQQRITSHHVYLAKQYGSDNICTIPISDHGELYAVLMLERNEEQPFDHETVELCERVASLAGPILQIKQQQQRTLRQIFSDMMTRHKQKLFGAKHARYKSVTVIVLLLSLFLVFAKDDYRVTAKATLEGTIQRAVVSPMEGYLASANKRAGDIVTQGEILATLDDKDLTLERLKWLSQREQYQKEYSNAFAKNDRSQVAIMSARVAQADAHLELVTEQLNRTQLTAPFAGVIVTGDLSQSLGTPVEKGQLLFEIAPLDQYRINLQVDERDIAEINQGNTGKLALTSLPGQTLPFTVEKITPVSVTEDGKNYFVVEAQLTQAIDALRPGMQGIGKITVGDRRYSWIWTHSLIDWMRLAIWSWLP